MKNEVIVEENEHSLDQEQLKFYLKEIENFSLKIISNPSTKHINKDISLWAMAVSKEASMSQHRIDLELFSNE
jgi:hypothetical protein